MATPNAAFYAVANSRYFLGAVGMLNSLRLLGHREPAYVLDCGLTPQQRELLAPHATLVPAPSDAPPYLLKTVMDGGHGGVSGRYETWKERAYEMAWALDRLGVAGGR